MKILDELIAGIPNDLRVRSVLVGAHWTVVCSRYCGMATSLMSNAPHGEAKVRDVGHLHEKSARELAQLAYSENMIEASVGIAAINSTLMMDESAARVMNASEALTNLGRGKNVALVGHFPFIPQLRQSVGQLWVIEKNPSEGDYPAEAAADLIPQADIVAITSSSLVNHTLDDLLALCPAKATVMLLGPSTPFSPVIFNRGASVISGTRIIDEAAVLRTVGQGASFRQVEGVKLLTFWNPASSVVE